MKILVIGAGYVGMANAVLFARHNDVIISDINREKIRLINEKKSPIQDLELEEYLESGKLNLKGVMIEEAPYRKADFIVIATPTNYDEERQFFDTSSIETAITEIVKTGSQAVVVIKSTIPLGYIKELCEKFSYDNVLFSPEFLREGKALYDNLYPSRIIVSWCKGNDEMQEKAYIFATLMKEGTLKNNSDVFLMHTGEAEAVKLFANTYLALRICFFNELDTYAQEKGLKTKTIIDGMCSDPRIGHYYNNPSFGYGGYCLPKDTKQLAVQFSGIPNSIVKSIDNSNQIRKKYIVDKIAELKPAVVGIYRLIMKKTSDNFRQSNVIDMIELLNEKHIKVIVYEPMLKKPEFMGNRVCKDLQELKRDSSIIIANRCEEELADVGKKLYTRDLYDRD
ncbi:MAG: nucleotide sugar dehydrogenase [Hungatella sp.]|jgi:UDPglucose 6-dehydrogenase|nr:nucleotide sugar dehydrogenase [Hungatella sp.]